MTVPHIASDTTPQSVEPRIDVNRTSSLLTDVAMFAMCIIAAVASFWDISLTFDSAVTVSAMAIMLYLVTITVYRTKYDGGISKGKQSEEYKTVKSVFDEMRNHIINNSLTDELANWCNDYRAKDIEQIRKSIICPHMSYNDYTEKYKNISKEKVRQSGLSKQAKKAINQANAITPLVLTPAMLLDMMHTRGLFGIRNALPMAGQTRRKIDLGFNYVSKFVVTFICGMFAVTILSDPSLDTFVQWTIRMFPIVLALFTGEPSGIRNILNVETRRVNAQTHLLSIFFADNSIDRFAEGKRNAKENGLSYDGVDSSRSNLIDRTESVLGER